MVFNFDANPRMNEKLINRTIHPEKDDNSGVIKSPFTDYRRAIALVGRRRVCEPSFPATEQWRSPAPLIRNDYATLSGVSLSPPQFHRVNRVELDMLNSSPEFMKNYLQSGTATVGENVSTFHLTGSS